MATRFATLSTWPMTSYSNVISLQKSGLSYVTSRTSDVDQFSFQLGQQNMEKMEIMDPPAHKEEEPPPTAAAAAATAATGYENRWSSLAAVTIGAYIGVLIRIGLEDLSADVSPLSVFPSFYAEFIGCIFMGFTVVLEDPIKAWFFPLFPLLTTGIAGSVTTYSSWSQAASADLVGLGPFQAQTGKGVILYLFFIFFLMASLEEGFDFWPFSPRFSPASPSLPWDSACHQLGILWDFIRGSWCFPASR